MWLKPKGKGSAFSKGQPFLRGVDVWCIVCVVYCGVLYVASAGITWF